MLGKLHKKLFLASLIFVMMFAAGCQTIGKIDVSKAIVQLATEKSMEGNLILTVELIPDPKATQTEESRAFLDTFGKVQLAIQDMRVQDSQHVSMKGELVLPHGSVPLHISLTDQEMSILLQGANAPIVLQMGQQIGLDSLGPLPLTEEIQGKLMEKLPEFSEKLIPFILDKTTKPQKADVKSVTETINNELLQLDQLSIQMNGSFLQTWLQDLLRGILADEAGTRELIGHLYDILGPELIQKAGQGNAIISNILGNRDQAVPLFTSVVQGLITNVLVEMEEAVDAQPGMMEALTDVNLNFYLDSELHTRKLSASLTVTPDASVWESDGIVGSPIHAQGIQSIKISVESERWNINQPVKADILESRGGFIVDETTELSELLAHFDENSYIYRLLKDELRVTHQSIPMPVGEYEEASESLGQVPYIDENNRTLAPARFVSDLLGAEIQWDGDLQQVTITAPAVDKTIVLTIGSNVALVNGEEVEFDTAAVIVPPGFTYVPVRFIVETLGAEVKFNAATRTVFVITE